MNMSTRLTRGGTGGWVDRSLGTTKVSLQVALFFLAIIWLVHVTVTKVPNPLQSELER